MNIKPYNYQEEAIQAFFHDYEKDPLGSGLIYMATGTGKTVVATEIAKRLGKPIVFLVHRDELVQQTLSKFLTMWPGVDIGVVQAETNHLGRHVTVASVQTLASGDRLEQLLNSRDDHALLFVDECFPAGTLVDGVPIEDVVIGSYVMSYNHSTGEAEYRRVIQKTKNKIPDRMIKINAGVNSFVCTENHPIYVNGKYTIAKNIKPGDLLYAKDYRGGLCKWMWKERNNQLKAEQKQMGRIQKKRSGILLERLQKRSHEKNKLRDYAKNKFESFRNFIRKDEKEKSNAQSRDKKKNVGNLEKNWSQTKIPWWEWNRVYRMAGENSFSFATGIQLGHGACGSNQGRKGKWLSNLLQTGHWMQRIKAWSRNRWREPQVFKKKTEGFEEGQFFRDVRVDSVEVLERGSEGRSASGSEEDYVYNLAVEGNNNYFVEGFLVHNCHHAKALTWEKIIKSFNCYWLGLTATPDRHDEVGLGDIFGKFLYTYTIVDAIADGFLSDFERKNVELDVDIDGVSTKSGDLSQGQLSELMGHWKIVEECVDVWKREAKDRKTIFFCVDVAHCEAVSQELLRKGVSANYVHGGMKKDERQSILRQFSTGKIQAVASCMVLTEGYDEPSVNCVTMLRPTMSEGLYIQMLGRGLRNFPGKKNCLLLDTSFNSDKHNIMQAGRLFTDQEVAQSTEASEIFESGVLEDNFPSIREVISLVRNREKDVKAFREATEYEWINIKGKMGIYLGSKSLGYLVIFPEENGWTLERHYVSGWEDRTEKITEKPTSVDWCVSLAEAKADEIVPEELKAKLNFYKKGEQDWHSSFVTANQKKVLSDLRIKEHPSNRAEAQKLISVGLFEKFENNRTSAKLSTYSRRAQDEIKSAFYNNELTVLMNLKRIDEMTRGEAFRVKFNHIKKAKSMQ